MPRARSRRSSSAVCVSPGNCSSIVGRPPGRARRIAAPAAPSRASATSCCCAPSWMLRSSRLRSCVLRGRRAASAPPAGPRAASSVLGQADVPQHQAGLRCEVANELLLGRVHRVVRAAARPTTRRAPRRGADVRPKSSSPSSLLRPRGDRPQLGRPRSHTRARSAPSPRPARARSATSTSSAS